MKILVIGGTRFFGVPMVKSLIEQGHEITVLTRGNTPDCFGNSVSRIFADRGNAEDVKEKLSGKRFDTVIDKIAYCSTDIRNTAEVVECDKYIHMSTNAVYSRFDSNRNVKEEEFDPFAEKVKWCVRSDGSYADVKKQAEYALFQNYSNKFKITAVRYPYVAGKNDYTMRLYFYVEHIIKGIPFYVDDTDKKFSFINEDEAGKFIAFLAEQDFSGAINGNSYGTISISEICDYVAEKTGKKAIVNQNGDPAPYNGIIAGGLDNGKAEKLGYRFSELSDWIYSLIDYYIEQF